MTKRLTIALVALVALLLVAVLPVSATTFYTVNNTINQGATVYIGEQQLNLANLYANMQANGGMTTIAHWASGNDITKSQPDQSINLDTIGATQRESYNINSGTFGSYTGQWYAINVSPSVNPGFANTSYGLALYVKDPSIVADVWDYNTSQIVTGKSVIQGDLLTFRITTNLNEVYDYPARAYSVDGVPTAATANMDIRLKSESGNLYDKVYAIGDPSTAASVSLKESKVNLSTWFLGTANNAAPTTTNSNVLAGWYTGYVDANNQNAYPAGVYSVYAESRVNGMKDNYQNNGADYTGKTVSAIGQVTIASNTVKIEANKDSVVRSKAFSITVTGKPNTVYHVWIKGVSTLGNSYDNQPPTITANQVGVKMDTAVTGDVLYDTYNDGFNGSATNGLGYAGGYQFQNNGSTFNLYRYVGGDDVAATNSFRTSLYANVTLNDAGKRTVQFTTTNWTKAQKYTIRVEQNFGNQYKSDEVDVKIEKGAVTIVAAGDQSYYLGEEVKFSGTNTESQKTYLFIVGPNLPVLGGIISSQDPRNAKSQSQPALSRGVHNDVLDTFQEADVLGDNTWSWKWGTSNVALDAGTYTVYAVSLPKDVDTLGEAAYGTVSIIIKKPFISATASQSTVAKGDAVFITGTAEGQPSSGVMIWILGKNYAGVSTEAVNSDSSFSYEVKKDATKNLYGGQYFIVAQHPMQNDRFDVKALNSDNRQAVFGMPITTANNVAVYTANQTSGEFTTDADFKLTGSSSLQGSDAAEALIEAINSANVDDTYTKLQILIEEPVITIDTVGDRHVGDKFTITATTNLAVDDEVLFEVYSSSFQPTQKSQSGEFSGASGTVKVTKGDSGLNKLSFDVDASTFKPDEYLVKADAVLQVATGTSLFNVLEASAPTATPTVVVTTAVPTTVATTIPTTVATPTKTPTQPGFGALVALIGLGAVALLVVRRH